MRFAVVLFLLLPLYPVDAATIILVRHAERGEGTEASVPITEGGRQRASTLARMLADAGIQTIYTTEVMRTQQTAAPIAKQLHIEPTVVPGRDIDGLVAKLQKLDPDQVVLVVGHSNTVPLIVAKLGGDIPSIADTEYDRMVIVHTGAQGKPGILTLRYGEPAH